MKEDAKLEKLLNENHAPEERMDLMLLLKLLGASAHPPRYAI